MHSIVPEDAKNLYKSVAYVLAVLISENDEDILKILMIITTIVEEEIEIGLSFNLFQYFLDTFVLQLDTDSGVLCVGASGVCQADGAR